jgi:hypothetical protein
LFRGTGKANFCSLLSQVKREGELSYVGLRAAFLSPREDLTAFLYMKGIINVTD